MESNVTKMCRALKEGRFPDPNSEDGHTKEVEQVVYYQSGIGTQETGLGAVLSGMFKP